MRLRPLVLGTVLAAGAATAPAWAQTQPQMPSVEAQRDYQLGLRVGVVHETNVAKSDKATADQRGVAPEDQYVRPLVTASVVQPLGQQALFLNGLAGYDFYNRNDQLNRQRYDVTAGGIGQFFGCRQTAYGTYRQQQSDLADLDTGTTENRLRVSALGVGLDCGRATGLRGGIILQKEQAKNSASTRKESDSDDQVLALTLAYGRPSLGTVTAIYNYSDAQYPNRINPGRPVGDGFFTQTLGVGVERRFGSRLFVAANVGRTELKREYAPPPAKQTVRVTSYGVEASYTPGSRMEVTISAKQDVKPSERTGKLYDVSEILEGSIRYRLGTRITLLAGHSYADVQSNVDTSQNVNVVTSSITNATFGSLQYRQSDKITLTLDAHYEDRNTNLPNLDYKDTRIGLTAEYSFF